MPRRPRKRAQVKLHTSVQVKELENEIQEGRKYSKIRQMLVSFLKSFASNPGPLTTKIPQEQCHGQVCSWSAKFHLPAKGHCKLQRCVKSGPWSTALQDIRRSKAAQAFESSSSSSRIVMTDNGPSINKQTNKPVQFKSCYECYLSNLTLSLEPLFRNLRPAYLLLLLPMRVTKMGFPKMLRLFCSTKPWIIGRIHS